MYFCRINIINGINKPSMKKIILLISLVLASVLSYAQNAPTAVKARQDGEENKALVEWAAPTTGGAVTGYKVYYNVKGASKVDSVRTTGLIAALSNLTQDTEYVIRIRSFKATTAPVDTTYSAYTAPVNLVIAKLPLVKPVVSVEATTPTKVTFRLIDTNLYETGFEITLEGGAQIITDTYGKINGEAVITIENLKPKTNYKITAKAIREVAGQPKHSSPVSDDKYGLTKVAAPPGAQNFEMNADCPYGVAFSWNYAERAEDIVYVVVQASFDGVNFTNIGNVNANEKFFYYSGAEPGVNYYYRVITQNPTGETPSGPFQLFTKPYVAPNPPKNVRSLQDGYNKYTTFLTVAWDHGDQDNACKTNILANTELRISVNGGAWQKKADFPNYIQQYRIENLNPKDIVQISLRSISDKGKESDWVTITDTTFGPSETPQDFMGVVNKDNFGNQVMYLSWTDTKDEGQYFVEKSTDGINFRPFAFLKEDITKLTDTELEEGASYYYRIKSGNWAGESNWSRIIGAFPISYTSAPNAPYGLVAKRDGNGVNLTWVDDSIKEEKYMVEKSSDGGNTFIKIAELGRDATAFRDDNIAAGKTYIYRVRAWNPTFEYSSYCKPAKIEIPAAASGFNFDATVYPNPVSQTLNIKAEGVNTASSYHLRIFDSNNHLVVDKEVRFGPENTTSIGIHSLVPGTYNMTLSNGKEKVSRKLLKL